MHRISCCLVLGATLLAGTPATAQQAPETPNALTPLLPHQKGRALCYVSRNGSFTFPLEDLTPGRKPRKLAFRRFVLLLRSEEHEADPTAKPPTPAQPYYGYLLVGEPAAGKRRLSAAGECLSNRPDGFGCAVECDGGTMWFTPVAGADALTMRVSDGAKRFRMTWGCGDEETDAVVLKDDPPAPAVRLEKADPRACRALERELKRRR